MKNTSKIGPTHVKELSPTLLNVKNHTNSWVDNRIPNPANAQILYSGKKSNAIKLTKKSS